MGSSRYIVSIDLGSGGPKVALVSDRGGIIASTRASTRLIHLPGGGVEQDPEEWWRVIEEGVQEIVGQRLVPVDEIVGIAMAAQWGVTVPVDATGKALSHAVHWMDSRGAPYSRRLMNGWIRVSGYGARRLFQWLRRTGGVPTHSGADALSHILFLKHERPEIYRQTYKFLEPVDYFGARMTGRFAMSYASVFPYVLADTRDCRRVRYSEKLVRLAGLELEKLPELVPVDTVLGPLRPEIADRWGLSRATRVMVGCGDSHAAIPGSGAVEEGQTHLCIGTSSWMTCLRQHRRIDVFNCMTSMPSVVPGRFMLVAEQGPAGKLLEILVERWLSSGVPPDQWDQRYSELLSLAERVPPGSGGLRYLPWVTGAGPPVQDADMRGGFLGMSLGSGPAEAVRSVLEGVAFNLRWMSGPVERLAGRSRPGALRFIGGGARSTLWCQILADVFGRPIQQVHDPHLAIARGAALVALAGLKLADFSRAAEMAPIARTFEPDRQRHASYNVLYEEFRRVFRVVRPLQRRWARSGLA